jgi:hypothetical protein
VRLLGAVLPQDHPGQHHREVTTIVGPLGPVERVVAPAGLGSADPATARARRTRGYEVKRTASGQSFLFERPRKDSPDLDLCHGRLYAHRSVPEVLFGDAACGGPLRTRTNVAGLERYIRSRGHGDRHALFSSLILSTLSPGSTSGNMATFPLAVSISGPRPSSGRGSFRSQAMAISDQA